MVDVGRKDDEVDELCYLEVVSFPEAERVRGSSPLEPTTTEESPYGRLFWCYWSRFEPLIRGAIFAGGRFPRNLTLSSFLELGSSPS